MATIWEIPLSPKAQVLRTEIGPTTYTLRITYNKPMEAWIMDIHDQDGNPLPPIGNQLSGLNGIPLVTGSDLLGQFRYLGIGGGVPMIVVTIGPGHSPADIPTFTDLGIDGRLYFKTLV